MSYLDLIILKLEVLYYPVPLNLNSRFSKRDCCLWNQCSISEPKWKFRGSALCMDMNMTTIALYLILTSLDILEKKIQTKWYLISSSLTVWIFFSKMSTVHIPLLHSLYVFIAIPLQMAVFEAWHINECLCFLLYDCAVEKIASYQWNDKSLSQWPMPVSELCLRARFQSNYENSDTAFQAEDRISVSAIICLSELYRTTLFI